MQTPPIKQCYLCGATGNLTVDHLPPAGFFPKPRPNNLITVPCCRPCNNGWSQNDEYMRAILSLSDIGRSPAGDVIFQQKVVPRIQTTSPKLRELLLAGLEDVAVPTDSGLQELCKWEFTREVFDKVKEFLVRMSKGLIRHYYPSLDYCNTEFVVRYVDDTKKLLEMKPLLDQLIYDERGEGVFRFGRNIAPRGCSGFWIYTFYDVTSFIVYYSDQHPRPWQKQG